MKSHLAIQNILNKISKVQKEILQVNKEINMNLNKIDKWILTNIYDFPAGQSRYNELYNEDEFILINEDPEILSDIYPVNPRKRLLS